MKLSALNNSKGIRDYSKKNFERDFLLCEVTFKEFDIIWFVEYITEFMNRSNKLLTQIFPRTIRIFGIIWIIHDESGRPPEISATE